MAPGMDLFRFDPPDPPDGAVRQFAHDLYGVRFEGPVQRWAHS